MKYAVTLLGSRSEPVQIEALVFVKKGIADVTAAVHARIVEPHCLKKTIP
jgi:hypothetical protein